MTSCANNSIYNCLKLFLCLRSITQWKRKCWAMPPVINFFFSVLMGRFSVLIQRCSIHQRVTRKIRKFLLIYIYLLSCAILPHFLPHLVDIWNRWWIIYHLFVSKGITSFDNFYSGHDMSEFCFRRAEFFVSLSIIRK